MSPIFGQEEAQRRHKLIEQLESEERAKALEMKREKFHQQLVTGTRRAFVRFLGFTILLFIICDHQELNNYAKQCCQYLASLNSKSVIRQNALNYEKQVNDIATDTDPSDP